MPLSTIDGPESDVLWRQEPVLHMQADPLAIKQWIMSFEPQARSEVAYMFLSQWDPHRAKISPEAVKKVLVSMCATPYGAKSWSHAQIQNLCSQAGLGAPALKYLLTLPNHPVTLASKGGLLLQACKRKDLDLVRLCMADPAVRFPPLPPARLEALENLMQAHRFTNNSNRLFGGQPKQELDQPSMKVLFPNPQAKEHQYPQFAMFFWILSPPNRERLSMKEHGPVLLEQSFKYGVPDVLSMFMDTQDIPMSYLVRSWKKCGVSVKFQTLSKVYMQWQSQNNPKAEELLNAMVTQLDHSTPMKGFAPEMMAALEKKFLQKAVQDQWEKQPSKPPTRKM